LGNIETISDTKNSYSFSVPAYSVDIKAHSEVEKKTTEKTDHKNSQDAFKTIGGNVKSISDAKAVFIGDVHSSVIVEVNSGDLIGKSIKDGDIILVEGVEKGDVIDPSQNRHTNTLPKDVKFTVMGWDNIELRDKAANGVRQMIDVNKRIKLVYDKFGNVPQFLVDMFNKIQREVDEYDSARNIPLIETVIEALKKTQGKIYIIAGVKHLETLKKEEIAGMPYIMLEPLDQTRKMSVEAYFGVKQEDSAAKNGSIIKSSSPNKVATVQNPDGKTKDLGIGWLVGDINIGNVVYINKAVANENDLIKFKQKGFLNKPLKIIDIS